MAAFAEYDDYDGLGLARLVREGQVSPAELLEEAIARTERVNGELNAVVHTFYDLARAAVADGLPPGPFHGVPFLLKDLHLHMVGTTLSNGSAAWRDAVSDFDSTLVSRYRDAGLAIFGRTNSPELGLNPVTEPREFGPSRNPWDTACTPGGSSGGAAAAVAAGVVPMAHASDGGGSIRIPASCCGLVGLKPSRGRIPTGPLRGEGWAGQSTSHIVSRSVRDSAAMLDATGALESGSPYAAPHNQGTFQDAVGAPPSPLRIAFSREKWGRGDYDPEVVDAIERTASLLSDLGHHVEEARPEFDGEAMGANMFTIITVNTALVLRERAAQCGCALDKLPMEDGTRFTAETGAAVSGPDYAAAINTNHELGRIFGRFHEQYDVHMTSTLSRPPVPVGFIMDAPEQEYADRLFSFFGDTGIFNQTGQPSLSLPLQWSADGLPMGMMFTAAYGNDALLLRLAGQLEAAAPWRDRRPPLHAANA